MERRHFCNFRLAGFTYYDGTVVFRQLEIGSALAMRFEPDNRFDPYAVALYFEGYKLGFVPKSCNHELSKLLEMGYSNCLEARIQSIAPEEHPENQVHVIVYLLKATV